MRDGGIVSAAAPKGGAVEGDDEGLPEECCEDCVEGDNVRVKSVAITRTTAARVTATAGATIPDAAGLCTCVEVCLIGMTSYTYPVVI